jgi:membrane protein DedA with SNARE-associated domain
VTWGAPQLIEFPQSEISTWGGGVVFLNVLLTRLGVPIPAVPVLLFAGSAIASGALSFWYVMPLAVLGALIGDGVWFTAGRLYGHRLISSLSRLSMSVGQHVRTTRSLFERFGAPIVSMSKFIPGLAIATPPLMGTTRVDPRIFIGWDMLGAAAWATFWLLGGAVFEKQLGMLVLAVRAHGTTVIDLVLAASFLYFVFRCIQRWRFKRWLKQVQITQQQLEAMLRTESPPVILDARPESALLDETYRIPGAQPLDATSPADIEAALPAARRVVYCVCQDEATAMRITQHMRHRGFTRIRALRGGLDAWARRGYAFEPFSHEAHAATLAARVKSLRNETEAVTLRGVAPRRGAPGKAEPAQTEHQRN